MPCLAWTTGTKVLDKVIYLVLPWDDVVGRPRAAVSCGCNVICESWLLECGLWGPPCRCCYVGLSYYCTQALPHLDRGVLPFVCDSAWLSASWVYSSGLV